MRGIQLLALILGSTLPTACVGTAAPAGKEHFQDEQREQDRQQHRNKPQSREPERRREDASFTLTRYPWVDLRAEVDEVVGATTFVANFKHGDGDGLAFNWDDRSLSVTRMQHQDRSSTSSVDHWTALYSKRTEWSIPLGGRESGLVLKPGIDIGLGLSVLSFDGIYDDRIDLALQLSGGAALQFSQALRISADVGYFITGYPGERTTDATFVSVGLTVIF